MAKIGIIEDNKKIRQLIQRYLDMQDGMECSIAVESVEEMLEYLDSYSKPDVLLMDIQLPGMSGIEGMKVFQEKFPEIEIIMLTVYHDSHKIFDSLKAGASGYFSTGAGSSTFGCSFLGLKPSGTQNVALRNLLRVAQKNSLPPTQLFYRQNVHF